MKSKLKIILGDTTRDTIVLIYDGNESIHPPFLNGEEYKGHVAIGFIQNIKCAINAYESDYTVEIIFPDYFSLLLENNKSSMARKIAWQIEKLKEFPNVKILLQDIFDKNKITSIKEIGTNGVIDSINLGE